MKKCSMELWHFMDLPAPTVAETCRVTLRTVRAWRDGYRRPPPAALALLDLKRRGRIVPHDWECISFSGGRLCLGHGICLNRSELDHYHMICEGWKAATREAMKLGDQVRKLQAENARLRAQLPSATVIPFRA